MKGTKKQLPKPANFQTGNWGT